MFTLKRYEGNPILSPHPQNTWENTAVCNPGAWYEDGVFSLLYRAAGDDPEHYIYFDLATSKDGFHFERFSDSPVFSPEIDGPSSGCVEDPRIVKFGDAFFVTYAYRPFPPGKYWLMPYGEVKTYDTPLHAPVCLKKNLTSSGLLVSGNLKTFRRLGRITKSYLNDRDVILFPEQVNGKYVMLHRPTEWVGEAYGCAEPAMWISFSDDLLEWGDSKMLISGKYWWDQKLGGATPPVKTPSGWLTLYHGVDSKKIYRVGAMLLDLNDPSRVLARASDFILEPQMDYETKGLYSGCVFPTGNVVVDGVLYVYYGGADKYCCVATCGLNELVEFVLSYAK